MRANEKKRSDLKDLREFDIHLIGLKEKEHRFEYSLNDSFFSFFETDLLQAGACKAVVLLNKTERLISAKIDITGHVSLVCDRSLDGFDRPVSLSLKHIYKFGETNEELSDNMESIEINTQKINLGDLIFQYICLSLPMKKLHPRYQEEEEDFSSDDDDDFEMDELTAFLGDFDDDVEIQDNAELVYTSGGEDEDEEESESDEKEEKEPDPRWAALKKLKDQPKK